MLKNISQWQKPVSGILTLILLSASAWMLGKMIWMVQSEPVLVSAWNSSSNVSVPSKARTIDISALQKGGLFGLYSESTPVVDTPQVVDAPKTRLNLVLVGVVASSEVNKNLAVIANRGAQSTYGINEVIEGTRAKLKAVFADRVIIDNSGRDETLMLDGIDYAARNGISTDDQPRSQRAVASDTRKNEAKLDAIREAILKNPQEIFQYVRLSQVKEDDSIVGYRVSPGRDTALFESVGLKDGDIAIEFNGFDLTQPNVMNDLASAVSEMTEINLSVLRDGQQHDIYIQL
ncbi:type II secretion system protein GspC [Vibrio diazotrophicus]|uniref:type II secretion system protein GspC n=1 Tax=Vibrio diazotrophicus TaxID=685 RepID=UPI00142E8EB0|nr:type II secretion system protein GspC [Vibrio diazotrophicus]NIY93573.1 type II secretion system protein GspC [Vibrio diazotrophicus]